METDLGPRFVVQRLLGGGASGTVYAAHDCLSGQEVAVKLLAAGAGDGAAQHRFLDEFRRAAVLRHPGLVRLYDVGETPGGRRFFTMERVEACSLREAAAAEGSWIYLARAAVSTCRVLSFLHGRGMVHGDLKPEHVLLPAPGSGSGWPRKDPAGLPAVVLIDLGLCRPAGEADLAGSLRLSGSPPYLAPELIAGEPPGPAADIYALGVTLYLLLAGRFPFEGDSLRSFLLAHLHAFPPPLNFTEEGEPPRSLERLVFRLLARRPEHRPASAEELEVALLRLPGVSPLPMRRQAPSLGAEATPRVAEQSAFAGREAEMTRLREILASLAAGSDAGRQGPARPGFLLLRGRPGAGRTRLLEELRLECRILGIHCFQALCQPHGDHPLAPLQELYLASEPRLAEGTAAADDPLAASLFAERSAPLPRLDQAAAQRERLLTRLLGRLEAASAGRPLVVAIDDLQWAEGTVVDLLVRLAGLAASRPVLACATLGEEEEPWPGEAERPGGGETRRRLEGLLRGGAALELALAPLGDEELAAAIRSLDLAERLSPATVRAVVAESRGSPAVALETARILLEARDEAAAGGETPSRIVERTFARRLQELRPPARRLLQILAVCPVSLEAGALRRASAALDDASPAEESVPPGPVAPSPEEIERLLGELLRDRLAQRLETAPAAPRHAGPPLRRPPSPRVLYTTGGRLLRSFLLAGLPGEELGAAHRAIAEALLRGEGAGSEEGPYPVPDDVLCHHLEKAQPPFAPLFTARHLVLAGIRAKRSHAPGRAARLLELALGRMEAQPESFPVQQRQMVLDNLGDIHTLTGRHGEAERCYRRALELGGARMEPAVRAGLERKLGQARSAQGDATGALRHLERARALAGAAGLPDEQARTLDALGRALRLRGDYTLALNLLLEESRRSGEAGAAGGEAAAAADLGRLYGTLGRVYELKGDMTAAIRFLRRSGELPAGRPQDTAALVASMDDLGQAHLLARDFAAAEELFLRSLELKRSRGNRPGEAETLQDLGELRAEAGRLDQALADLRAALAIRRELERDPELEDTLAALGSLHLRRQEHAAAAGHLEEAVHLQLRSGRPRGAAARLNQLAEARLRLGRYVAALEAADQALAIQRQRGRRGHILRSAELKAAVLLELGRWEDCRAALAVVQDGAEAGQEGDFHRAAARGLEAELLIASGRTLEAAAPAGEAARLYEALALTGEAEALACRLLLRLDDDEPLPEWWTAATAGADLLLRGDREPLTAAARETGRIAAGSTAAPASPPAALESEPAPAPAARGNLQLPAPREETTAAGGTPATTEEDRGQGPPAGAAECAAARALLALRSASLEERISAVPLLRRALELAETLQLPELEWRLLFELSRQLGRQGNRAGRLDHLRRAVEVLRHLSGMIEIPSWRLGYLGSHGRDRVFAEIERIARG